MERFVRLVVGGGLALLAGLWAVTLTQGWSVPRLSGVGLVVLGVAGLAVGIHDQLEY